MTHYLLSPSFKSHLENAYFVGGVVIAIASIVALYQIILTKRIARSNAMREAYRLAAEQCAFFAADILPLLSSVKKEFISAGITINSKAKVRDEKGGFAVNLSDIDLSDIDKINKMITPPGLLLNRLEAFALYFVTGVASEKAGFNTLGSVYCDIVKEFMPYIALVADDELTYPHVGSLYKIWKQRKERIRLTMDKAKIEKKLKETPKVTINPIGT